MLRHFFLPHHSNNQRAKFIHHDSIFLVALIFFLATYCLTIVKDTHPGVLGVSVNMSAQELLILTNAERQKVGLAPLTYNDQLALAAHNKAENMFSDDYWAHINPKNGKTPWIFIQGSGYTYTYAGENLARGFADPDSVVQAWMASPSHRANVLNSHYQDVGFAIEEGTLTGEKNTILVVEMFGGKNPVTPEETGSVPGTKAFAQGKQPPQQVFPSIIKSPLIDRSVFAKNITQILLILFIVLFVIDLLVVQRKNITRLVGHNLDHILFLTGILLFIIIVNAGAIF